MKLFIGDFSLTGVIHVVLDDVNYFFSFSFFFMRMCGNLEPQNNLLNLEQNYKISRFHRWLPLSFL